MCSWPPGVQSRLCPCPSRSCNQLTIRYACGSSTLPFHSLTNGLTLTPPAKDPQDKATDPCCQCMDKTRSHTAGRGVGQQPPHSVRENNQAGWTHSGSSLCTQQQKNPPVFCPISWVSCTKSCCCVPIWVRALQAPRKVGQNWEHAEAHPRAGLYLHHRPFCCFVLPKEREAVQSHGGTAEPRAGPCWCIHYSTEVEQGLTRRTGGPGAAGRGPALGCPAPCRGR